jgi:hypothetical protein
MSTGFQTVLPHMVHLGALLYLVCFLFRNQIYLRLFALLGDFAYIAYYFGVSTEPLWAAIVWSALNVLVNVLMMWYLVKDQHMTRLSDNELSLYQNLKGLTPGQFRKLISKAQWRTAPDSTVLTVEGLDVSELHYVLSGGVEIAKLGRSFDMFEPSFIGELAYLRTKPATATVRTKPGAVYVSWPHHALRDLVTKDEALQQSLTQILNVDLAEKLART